MAHCIAIIGAGGKTTAMMTLARALESQRVLVTTTTHIYPVLPPESRELLVNPTSEELRRALEKPLYFHVPKSTMSRALHTGECTSMW